MRVVSVQAGMPREVKWRGRAVLTSIWKQPVEGRVTVRTLNLDGDRQSDLTVHGGVHKAVYGYPSEHYPFWRSEFPELALPWGALGENLTTEGLLETEVRIGDRFRIGSVELRVTQPRMPCYKFGIRFGREEALKRMLETGFSGFYFAVEREGELGAGDPIELLSRNDASMTVREISSLYASDRGNLEQMRRASQLRELPESWREWFERLLEEAG